MVTVTLVAVNQHSKVLLVVLVLVTLGTTLVELVETQFMMVTVKLQVLLFPHESVAVEVTVVVPNRNRLPLGGTLVTVGDPPHPPPAVTVKKTLVAVPLYSMMEMLEEQVMLTGAFVTFTEADEVLLLVFGSVYPAGAITPMVFV